MTCPHESGVTFAGCPWCRIAALEAAALSVCDDASRSTAVTGEGEMLMDVRSSLIWKLQAALDGRKGQDA